MKEGGDSDDSDDEPAKDGKKLSFIEQKIAERKAKKGTQDPKKAEGRDPNKPIAEGPFDDDRYESYNDERNGGNSKSMELNFFYYDNVWLDVKNDKPAAQVIQNIAARSGLTNAIQSGKIQGENCLYNIVLQYSSQDTSDTGDYMTPEYSSSSINIDDAQVSMEAGDTHIPVVLTPQEVQEIGDAYGEDIQGMAQGL